MVPGKGEEEDEGKHHLTQDFTPCPCLIPVPSMKPAARR